MSDAVKKEGTAKKGKKPHAPRNFKIPGGVWRYSRSVMYSRRRTYLMKKTTTPKVKPKRKPKYVVKPIGGEKNGGTRRVLLRKPVSLFFIYNSVVFRSFLQSSFLYLLSGVLDPPQYNIKN